MQQSPCLINIDQQSHLLGRDANDGAIREAFAGYFGPHAQIEDLIRAHQAEAVRAETVFVASRAGGPRFQTRVSFADPQRQVSGTFINVWQRQADGSLLRTREGSLIISGSRSRLALQLHSNMVQFARATRCVHRLEVEARGIGRYAYRFLHGVAVDEATRADMRQRLLDVRGQLNADIDLDGLSKRFSPRDLVEHVLLSRLPERWMQTVAEIVERQGYWFTVDQVVDVARRPLLALLIDRPRYTMSLDPRDDLACTRLRDAVELGRGHKALRRVEGVLGSPFTQLPRRVSHALITCRPFLFPSPRGTPAIPELPADCARTCCALHVRGFCTQDDVLLPVQPADPLGSRLRDYRRTEVEQATQAIREGRELITVTGLSGSGKSEVFVWNLERSLALLGHRCVSLDAMQLLRRDDVEGLLGEIADQVRPTVLIFDESLYLRGERADPVRRFAQNFLQWPGQHVILVGGGRVSPDAQHQAIELELAGLFAHRRSARVSLLPKRLCASQVFRFLGLTRIDWLSGEQKIELLRYTLKRVPAFFVSLMPVRIHEHPELGSLDEAKELVDQGFLPDEWRDLVGMEFGPK